MGNIYQTGDQLVLATAVNNVSTYARGELFFNGVTFTANAAVTAIQFTGNAVGAARTYSGLAVQNINSNGAGLTVDVVISTGGGNTFYDSVTIVSGGSGYLPGDTLYIAGNTLGGAAGARDLIDLWLTSFSTSINSYLFFTFGNF